ncbi:unnamed protein product [Rotaria sordida]|uniref:DUF7789 domain-containing protein n=1 Tax=Rotaria sordida TaxID=392033 RepID=A0A813SHV6_9BILA|nr:unnamed protein product [Rotaria sordida]CAF0757640.1 unnamed protein product [Rotaria sordida]CAF0800821.1 unnamed protein product [Rotaria sordida]CAF0842633.1 unnamed protein product [Rotaria sordida]CAF3531874.1 unnamed protein product [Rotaria sordida]
MDSGRTPTFAGGLNLATENALDESGFLGTRRGFGNIRWYEYTFLILGILAALVTDGLTIARLVNLGSLNDPDFAYGILILVHSIFLLLFLITGIFYQRITDIVAFFLSAVMLTVYVIAHYFARRHGPDDSHTTQAKIRLARLIFTIIFNVCFIPLAIIVIKDYQRDEFSKRLFGAFPTARLPLKIYSIFDCVARVSTMLSISSLLLNLYNYTGYETVDRILLIVGIPFTLLWLGMGIGMARLENYILVCIFYLMSLFQLGFLGYSLYTAIQHSIAISGGGSTTLTTTTQATAINLVPILQVLYVCISFNLLAHILSMVLGFWCTRNFNKGLKERVFNNKIDKWIQQRWSNK